MVMEAKNKTLVGGGGAILFLGGLTCTLLDAIGRLQTAKSIVDLVPSMQINWLPIYIFIACAGLVLVGFSLFDSVQKHLKIRAQKKAEETERLRPNFDMTYQDAVMTVAYHTTFGKSLSHLNKKVRKLMCHRAIWEAVCTGKMSIGGASIKGSLMEKLTLNFNDFVIDVEAGDEYLNIKAMKPRDQEDKTLYVGLAVDSRDIERLFPS